MTRDDKPKGARATGKSKVSASTDGSFFRTRALTADDLRNLEAEADGFVEGLNQTELTYLCCALRESPIIKDFDWNSEAGSFVLNTTIEPFRASNILQKLSANRAAEIYPGEPAKPVNWYRRTISRKVFSHTYRSLFGTTLSDSNKSTSKGNLLALPVRLNAMLDKSTNEYGRVFLVRLVVSIQRSRLAAISAVSKPGAAALNEDGLRLAEEMYLDWTKWHNERALQLKNDLFSTAPGLVSDSGTHDREEPLPTIIPPSKPRRDRSGQDQTDRANLVSIQTYVGEHTRDGVTKLADLTGRSTAELLSGIIDLAVLESFVPPATGPAHKNDFPVQVFIEESAHEKLRELAKLNRLSIAELLRRLLEHIMAQKFVPKMSDALGQIREQARARLRNSLTPSKASSLKARPG